MNNSKISVRYAKALVENASENNILPEVKQNIDFIIQCINELPELQILLKSPVIKISEKLNMFRLAFASYVHPLTLSFLNLILINKREEFLDAICRHIIFLYNKKLNIKPGLLVTPRPLDIQTKEKIVSVIAKKLNAKIELQEKYDEKLLGGFLLRIDDQQIDASIASQVAKIKSEITS